jgi:hypothetical protein
MWRPLLWVSVIAGFVALWAATECQDSRGRLQIVVSVFNRADVEEAAVLAAEKTVDNIYTQSGLGIIWRNWRPQAEEELQFELRPDRIELVLNIEHQSRMLTADTYGVWSTVSFPLGSTLKTTPQPLIVRYTQSDTLPPLNVAPYRLPAESSTRDPTGLAPSAPPVKV